MKYQLENQKLVLFFEGEINSVTASSVEADVFKTIGNQQFNQLILDFNKVSYISSAGLRIILKLKQTYVNTSIVGATLEVYDVLQMTGFTKIMEVHKAINNVDVTGCEVIGEGYSGIVYRINKDTIIKVFKNEHDIKKVERELNLAKQAFVLGVPTAISFDIVMVDGQYGVRFEMLDSMSLRDIFRDQLMDYDVLLDKYVKLLKTINTTESFDDSLPDFKVRMQNRLEAIKPCIGDEAYAKAKKLLDSVEDRKTFIHGDCHVKNIMLQGDELFLIDMDTLSRGNPIFELSALYCPYIAFEEDDPGNNERFLGLKSEFTRKLYYDIVSRYTSAKDAIDKISIIAYIHMIWWNRHNEPENNARLEGCKGRLLKLLAQYDDLNIGV